MDPDQEISPSFLNSGDEKALKGLFEYIYKTRGIDFALYRQATVKRKIQLRLQETGSEDYRKYLDYLKTSPDEIDNLIKALTIKVSNFFRNPIIYELLSTYVLPELISEFGFVKVWSIGCARGEEPYSVAIIIDDLLKRETDFFEVRIVGTDIDRAAIDHAVLGEYDVGDMLEIKKKYFDTYFTLIPRPKGKLSQSQLYRIKHEIKSMVQFDCTDIMNLEKLKAVKPNAHNLILCRNVLIYMNRELQEAILKNFADMVYENGYLVIGETETIPESVKIDFEQVLPPSKIYKKRRMSTL
jgi:chemotaxis methyl-accepting protein methylase